MSSSKRSVVAQFAITAFNAGGALIAACMLAVPPHEVPNIPTLPLHQGCAAIQSITFRASASSSSEYMSGMRPSLSPDPRMSTRRQE